MSECSSKDPHPDLPSLHNNPPVTVTPGNSSSLSLQHPALHQHGSVSTSASSSTNSSPTTTISTVESEPTEERSPSSSPDSPVAILPLSSFKSQNIGIPSTDDLTMVPPSPHPGYTRSISPSKKPRNTKNLSLNVPPPTTPPPAVAAQPAEGPSDRTRTPRSMSAPSSPAFIVPPPPPQNPRRRPSNLGLTIKLPGSLPEKSAVRGSSTTGGSGLRHHQSSPSLFSPAPGGIPGGMKLPSLSNHRPPRLFHPPRPNTHESFSSSMSSSSISNSPPMSPEPLQEMDEEDEEPRSGEAKSPAYPAGPICIFEPNIYLYAEPDAELASQFDLVVNVAREVLNPFKAAEKKNGEDEGKHSVGSTGDMELLDRPPDTACTDASFTTAFEEALFSPISIPRQQTPEQKPKYREPEYVHMPWDHNTPILDDLPKLVNLIDERANAGKKVLVHCQCGVSRSATLLIAYAMFKNPEKPMQEAYSAVKAQSKWIGPNMSLIYQLTDWKKKITSDDVRRNGGVGGVRGLLKGGANKGFGRSRSNTGPIDDRIPEPLPEPQTAPLPETRSSPAVSPLDPGSPLSSDRPIPHMVRTRSANGGFVTGVSPGPSSAPPGMITIPGAPKIPADNRQSWPDGDLKLEQVSRRPSPPPSWAASARERDSGYMIPPQLPPTSAYLMDNAERDIFGREKSLIPDDIPPPTPGFASPRNSGYFGIPIRRPGTFGNIFADPRSPTQRGADTPVIRNILDVL